MNLNFFLKNIPINKSYPFYYIPEKMLLLEANRKLSSNSQEEYKQNRINIINSMPHTSFYFTFNTGDESGAEISIFVVVDELDEETILFNTLIEHPDNTFLTLIYKFDLKDGEVTLHNSFLLSKKPVKKLNNLNSFNHIFKPIREINNDYLKNQSKNEIEKYLEGMFAYLDVILVNIHKISDRKITLLSNVRKTHLKRNKIGYTISTVTYITNKKYLESKECPEGLKNIEWSHSWIVRGHWRYKEGLVGKDRNGERNQEGRTWVIESQKQNHLELKNKIRIVK